MAYLLTLTGISLLCCIPMTHAVSLLFSTAITPSFLGFKDMWPQDCHKQGLPVYLFKVALKRFLGHWVGKGGGVGLSLLAKKDMVEGTWFLFSALKQTSLNLWIISASWETVPQADCGHKRQTHSEKTLDLSQQDMTEEGKRSQRGMVKPSWIPLYMKMVSANWSRSQMCFLR